MSLAIGDRVRVRLDTTCAFCAQRDPRRALDGQPGTIVSDMRDPDRSPIPGGSLVAHFWEVRLDSGPLRGVQVPFFGGTIELPEPNFADMELERIAT